MECLGLWNVTYNETLRFINSFGSSLSILTESSNLNLENLS